jgi:hypothetical protein
MRNEEKEYLEAVYAGLAMAGYIMNGGYHPEEIPTLSKAMAKLMMEDDNEGIVAIKPKRKVKA